MFVITEWFERYEVNDKGQPAKAGDKLRAGPLVYIRSKVHGHSQSAGFHAMQIKAGRLGYQVFGVFQKFLEISGNSGALTRGILLNHRGKPAEIGDLAHILRDDEKIIRHALEVLTDTTVGWMLEIDSVIFQEFQESQENWSAFLNTTQHNTIQHKSNQVSGKTRKKVSVAKKASKRFCAPPVEAVRDFVKQNPELNNVDPDNFFKSFNESGWVDTQGKPVKNWKLKLRTWSKMANERKGSSQAKSKEREWEEQKKNIEAQEKAGIL